MSLSLNRSFCGYLGGTFAHGAGVAVIAHMKTLSAFEASKVRELPSAASTKAIATVLRLCANSDRA
jgi:hypothetical protein